MSNIIWKWNGTDTTQFTRVLGNGSITVASSMRARRGVQIEEPCLALTTPENNTTIWLVDRPMPERYLVHFRIDSSGSGGGVNAPIFSGSGIVAYYQDNTHWVSAVLSGASPVAAGRARDGAAFRTGSTSGKALETTHCGQEIFFQVQAKNTGATPLCYIKDNLQRGGDQICFFGSGSHQLSDPSWTPTAATSSGLVINALSGSFPSTQLIYISNFIIFKHPMDWD